MVCVSAKHEPHNPNRTTHSDNDPAPRTTSFEGRPLHSLTRSSTRVLENGGGKREKEQRRRSKNWTRLETVKLIRLRSVMEPRFSRSGRKAELWNEISEALVREGIYRDSQQCRDKWEKLTAGFKEVRDGVREKEEYPYYDELEPILSAKVQRRETQIHTHNHRLEIQSDGEDSEDAVDGDFPARKRRKSGEGEETMEDLKELLESLMERQHIFFVNLLESMERREKSREKIRQDREEKWREEERAQRVTFQNAMILLTKKLGNDGMTRCNNSGSCYYTPGEASNHSQENDTAVGGGGGGVKRRSRNWKRGEVLMLIKVRGEMEGRFAKSKRRRGVLWEEVAELLCAEGVTRDAKQCRDKWDKLMAEYKEVSDGKRDRGDSPYFADIVAVTRCAGARGGGGPGGSSSFDTPTNSTTFG